MDLREGNSSLMRSKLFCFLLEGILLGLLLLLLVLVLLVLLLESSFFDSTLRTFDNGKTSFLLLCGPELFEAEASFFFTSLSGLSVLVSLVKPLDQSESFCPSPAALGFGKDTFAFASALVF